MWGIKELVCGPVLNNVPVVHEHDKVCNFPRETLPMTKWEERDLLGMV